ncbi:MAG: class I SAM-dependent methyltransferase [Proteobacteria bacterium]|nr:class I SAM-dependent methyltransferase [Pseudomonadota bacterium]
MKKDTTKVKWDNAYRLGMTMWYPSECLIRFMAKNFKKQIGIKEYKTIRPAETILDLGCGNGANVLFFNRLGYRAYGVDISRVAVDLGNKLLAENGFKETLICIDMEHLSFENNYYDIVVSHAALDHILYSQYLKVIKNIKTMLKNGGFLFITLRSTEGFDYESKTATKVEPRTLITGDKKALNSPFENPYEKGIPQHFFTFEEIMESLSDFSIITIEKNVESSGPDSEFVDGRWFITAQLAK